MNVTDAVNKQKQMQQSSAAYTAPSTGTLTQNKKHAFNRGGPGGSNNSGGGGNSSGGNNNYNNNNRPNNNSSNQASGANAVTPKNNSNNNNAGGNNNNNRTQVICSHCEKIGHDADHCFKNPNCSSYNRNSRAFIIGTAELNLIKRGIKENQKSVLIQLPGLSALLTTVFDTGASHSCIDAKLCKKLNLTIKPIPADEQQPILLAASGQSVPRIGTVTTDLSMHFMYDARPSLRMENVTFEVMNIPVDFYIGLDLMQHTSPNDDGVRFNHHQRTPPPKMCYFDLDLDGKPVNVNCGKPAMKVPKMQARAAVAKLAREVDNDDDEMRTLEAEMLNLGVGNRAHAPKNSRLNVSAPLRATTTTTTSSSSSIPHVFAVPPHSVHPARNGSTTDSPPAPCAQCQSESHTTVEHVPGPCSHCYRMDHGVEQCPDVLKAVDAELPRQL